MGFTDFILKLVSKIPSLVNITINQNAPLVSLTKNDSGDKVEYNDSSKKLTINTGKFEDEDKKDLNAALSLALDEGFIFLEEKAKETIEDLQAKEKTSEVQTALNFLRGKIPFEDINIWRAALYVKSFHEKDMRSKISFLKYQIRQRYGSRGSNIANLCAAGYLENALMPIHESALERFGPEKALEIFNQMYTSLVSELPNTIFVSYKMTQSDVVDEINRRKKFGVFFVNIHGIGTENVLKIKAAVENADPENNFSKSINQNGDIVLVKIIFKSTSS